MICARPPSLIRWIGDRLNRHAPGSARFTFLDGEAKRTRRGFGRAALLCHPGCDYKERAHDALFPEPRFPIWAPTRARPPVVSRR